MTEGAPKTLGVMVCSARELNAKQLARAEEHAEMLGSPVTVVHFKERTSYLTGVYLPGEQIIPVNTVLPIVATDVLDSYQTKKDPGKYSISRQNS